MTLEGEILPATSTARPRRWRSSSGWSRRRSRPLRLRRHAAAAHGGQGEAGQSPAGQSGPGGPHQRHLPGGPGGAADLSGVVSESAMSLTAIRSDLIGKSIQNVLQSPWQTEEGISSCDVFVVFAGGLVIQLNGMRDNLYEEPIPRVSLDGTRLAPAEVACPEADFVGQLVSEVLVTSALPFFSIALLLANDLVLCYRDLSPFRMGACVLKRTDFASPVLRYWGHRPL